MAETQNESTIRIDRGVFKQEVTTVNEKLAGYLGEEEIDFNRMAERARLERYRTELLAVITVEETLTAGGTSIDAIRALQGRPFSPSTETIHFDDEAVRAPIIRPSRPRPRPRVVSPPPGLAMRERIRIVDEDGV